MMKYILSLWLFQTLLLLILEDITICHAVDRSKLEELARYYYEEPNIYNRRGYGERYNDDRANLYYTAYADEARRINQHDSLARTDAKFTKPANLRKHFYSDMRSAHDTAPNYGYTRNGDIDEIDVPPAGYSSTEQEFSNSTIALDGGIANNTMSDSPSISLSSRANFVKQSASCSCEGSDPDEEISFLCFSSKDGSENLSIKYKGTTMFNIEDITKAYKLYHDNMQAINFNFDKKLKGDSNFKNEFQGSSKFNFDVSTFTTNEGNLDLDEIKEDNFNINTFDKVDMKTTKKGTNEFNFDFMKSADQEIDNSVNENNKFQGNTKFNFDVSTFNTNEGSLDSNSDSKFDLDEIKNNNKFNVNAFEKVAMKTIKKGTNEFNFDFMKSPDQEIENNGNSNFNLETNTKMEAWKKAGSKKNSFNFNHYSFDTDVQTDVQADFEAEAQAKALAQAKAIAKAQAFLQAKAAAKAEAKAQTAMQQKIVAQAQAEAKAQAMAEAMAQAKLKLNAQSKAHAQAKAQALADARASAQASAQASSQASAQGNSQATAHAYSQASSQGNSQGKAQSFSQSHSHSHSFGASDGNSGGLHSNGLLAKGVQLGVGGLKTVLGGFGLGIGGGVGAGIGGGIGGGFGGSEQVGFGSGIFRSSKDGLGMGTTTYTAEDINYGDLYDEHVDDRYVSTGYPGVLAYPVPNDSPVNSNRYSDGLNQNDEYVFGDRGYQRYH